MLIGFSWRKRQKKKNKKKKNAERKKTDNKNRKKISRRIYTGTHSHYRREENAVQRVRESKRLLKVPGWICVDFCILYLYRKEKKRRLAKIKRTNRSRRRIV